MNHKILITSFLLISLLGRAQETVLISKEDVLVRVIENSNTLKMSQQDVLMAKGDFNQTNAVVLPNISISHTGIATTNPLMNFGVKLNQKILTAADFDPALLNNPSQVQDFSTKIEIQQPIFNLDGLYQRKAAKAKLNAAKLQSERTEDYMALEVEKSYMQLQLAYKTVTVLEKAYETAKENKRLADNRFKQGYLQKTAILSVDIRVLEIQNQLQNAKSNIINISNYVSILMNDTSYKILKPTDELEIVTQEVLVNKISEDRADIKAMNFAADAYAQMYKADKMSFLPRLNAFGTYELYDTKVFQGRANGYLFGAELKWNILEGTKRFGKKQKSKAAFEKSRIEKEQYVAQSQVELNKANRMLQDAKNNLKLSELALKQSKEALRIRTNRFEQGLERTTDLLIAETQYSQMQLEYYATIFKHNFAIVYLQFLTK